MSREPLRLRLRAAPGRRLAHALAAAVAAIAIGAGAALALPGGPAEAAGPALAEEAIGDEIDAPEVQLLLAAEAPMLPEGDAAARFDVVIRNTGEDPVPAGTLTLSLGLTRLTDPDQLRDGADESRPLALRIAEVEVADTAAESEQRLAVTVSREDLAFGTGDEPGVYSVLAELRPEDSGPALTARAPVVWRGPTPGARLPLTLVVPLMIPSEIATMPTSTELGELVPRLDRLLQEAETHRATLAVDPRLIAGIRAFGEDAPASARAFLERLEASALPTFLLQFADADPAAQAALEFDQLLRPTGLSYLTRLGRFDAGEEVAPEEGDEAAADTPESEETAPDDGSVADGELPTEGEAAGSEDPVESEQNPADTVEPVDPSDPVPSLEQLLAWPQGYAGAWPAAGQVDSATLELLRRSGITSVLLDSSNALASDGTRFELDGLDTMVADGGLGDAAERALGSADETERSAARGELAALLAFAAERQSPGMVLALDRGAVADAEDPAELLEWIGSLAWVDDVPESLQPEGSGSLVSGGTAEERRELLRAAVRASEQIDGLAPLLERPEYLTEYQRVRLLAAFATRYAAPEVDFRAVAERRGERDEELLQGVRVVTTANTQLVGVSSQLPVQLHNSLPFDALVSLRVAPLSAGIAVPERRFDEQLVAAGGNTTVLVPVRSRVSSGQSALIAQVTDTADEEVFFSDTLRLTIRSSFETILLFGLGALAALLFGLGIWRSVRRRRERRNSPAIG